MTGKRDPAAPFLLPARMDPGAELAARLEHDYRSLARADAREPLADRVRADYRIDLAARLGPLVLPHPFGKGSGQLSLNVPQVEADARAGLAFTVLKTVIAERPDGHAAMAAWRVKASRMAVHTIASRDGEQGWTVSWIGRGWEGNLESYAEFLRGALAAARGSGLQVIASAKFHLPVSRDEPYDAAEYAHTLGALADAWREGGGAGPLVLEKDFSPTLAGAERSRDEERILEWIAAVPRLVREHAPGPVLLGLKLMNALFADGFQVEMLCRAAGVDPPLAFITCFNRLFDPERVHEGHRGIAYGGPDLSRRNLEALAAFAGTEASGAAPPLSATGNIASGRLMAEYALRGATSGQVHTFFQLPREHYLAKSSRPRAALHELVYHPREGLIAALAHIRRHVLGQGDRETIRFLDLPAIGRGTARG